MEQQAISSDLIRGHIDTIILHTLLDGDKFAQQISDSIEAKSDNEYKINQATLYSSLKRLEGLKHVSSYWFDSDAGGRRKFFKLTDSGKAAVEGNLSNWSYSRAIIDKLMDCAPQPIYKTQYVEKIVEVPVEVPVVKEVIKEVAPEPQSSQVPTQTELKTEETQSSDQEINFRNILNGLIKSTTVHKQQETTELEPLEKTIPESEVAEKPKFNETIYETDYNAQKSNNNGKIDFGDLTLKAAKEGYKIRISSKDSYASTGTLLLNKLNLYSAFLIYLLTMSQFLIYTLIHGKVLNLSLNLTLILIVAFSVFPILSLVMYLKNPKKNSAKKITADSMLTAAIIVFNLMLITFAAALLFNLDFSNGFNSLVFVAIPLTLYGNVFIYFTIKYFISKSKVFYLKGKKTA
jgi:PadR family transcriptional regulator PadR